MFLFVVDFVWMLILFVGGLAFAFVDYVCVGVFFVCCHFFACLVVSFWLGVRFRFFCLESLCCVCFFSFCAARTPLQKAISGTAKKTARNCGSYWLSMCR